MRIQKMLIVGSLLLLGAGCKAPFNIKQSSQENGLPEKKMVAENVPESKQAIRQEPKFMNCGADEKCFDNLVKNCNPGSFRDKDGLVPNVTAVINRAGDGCLVTYNVEDNADNWAAGASLQCPFPSTVKTAQELDQYIAKSMKTCTGDLLEKSFEIPRQIEQKVASGNCGTDIVCTRELLISCGKGNFTIIDEENGFSLQGTVVEKSTGSCVADFVYTKHPNQSFVGPHMQCKLPPPAVDPRTIASLIRRLARGEDAYPLICTGPLTQLFPKVQVNAEESVQNDEVVPVTKDLGGGESQYTHATIGFSLAFPKTWDVWEKHREGYGPVVTFRSPAGYGGERAAVTYIKVSVKQNYYSYSKPDDFFGTLTDSKFLNPVTSRTKITVADQPALRIFSSKYNEHFVYFVVDKNEFEVYFDGQVAEGLQVFERMLATFQLK